MNRRTKDILEPSAIAALKEQGHTPGSWKLYPEERMIESEFPINLSGDYDHICDLRVGLDGKIDLKIARLIESAPELLKALTDAAAVLKFYENGPVYERARAILKKAGEA